MKNLRLVWIAVLIMPFVACVDSVPPPADDPVDTLDVVESYPAPDGPPPSPPPPSPSKPKPTPPAHVQAPGE